MNQKEIDSIHQKSQDTQEHLYEVIKREFPQKSIEDRLKYLAAVLDKYADKYSWNSNNRTKDEGYSIVNFYPKKD